jgi:HEPN domain-containing protein
MSRKKSSRVFRATDGYDPVDVLKYARGHLRSCEVLFGTSHHCFDSAGHLAHLSIELLLKASLLHATSTFPDEHSLERLKKLLVREGVTFRFSNEARRGYALLCQLQEARYPKPAAPIEIGTEDLPLFQHVWDEMLEQLQPELRTAFLTSDQLEKGGRVLMAKPKPRDREPST